MAKVVCVFSDGDRIAYIVPKCPSEKELTRLMLKEDAEDCYCIE